MTERFCPACSKPVPLRSGPGRPAKWCSASCRAWVSKVGGPLAAADLKEAYARSWERTGSLGNPRYKEIAAECRAEASALRKIAESVPSP
jgi:hypothetical protein